MIQLVAACFYLGGGGGLVMQVCDLPAQPAPTVVVPAAPLTQADYDFLAEARRNAEAARLGKP